MLVILKLYATKIFKYINVCYTPNTKPFCSLHSMLNITSKQHLTLISPPTHQCSSYYTSALAGLLIKQLFAYVLYYYLCVDIASY